MSLPLFPSDPHAGDAVSDAAVLRLDGVERRRRLRTAAVQMFSERGVGGTTMQGLARRAGLGGGRVTAYYDGKADLLAEVVHNHLAELALRVDRAATAEAGSKPEIQLTAMMQALLTAIQADAGTHLIMLNEQKSLSHQERTLVISRYELLAYAFGDPLIAAIPALRSRPALARVCVQSIIGLASSSASWFRPEGALDTPTYARMLIRMMLEGARGLRPRKRRAAPQ